MSVTVLISFGQVHRHEINGKVFDKDCLARITGDTWGECRKKAFYYFGPKFCTDYPETAWSHLQRFYPRGIIDVGDNHED